MPQLVTVPSSGSVRARRWDAVVLGSGVAAMVAAVRLGRAGHRILVVEEANAARAFPGLREPFLLSGARDQGLLDACLRDLAIPLIDRRRILADPLALQVLAPDYRIDIGEADLTASELVAWGLSKPDEARDLVRALVSAGEAEREVLLAATTGRVGRNIGRALARGAANPALVRGLPDAAANAAPPLAGVFDALTRTLSHQAEQEPPPEARARLLGALMSGGARFADGPPWLWGLLRRRVESVYAEFRTVSDEFRIIQSDGQAGIQAGEGGELWLGRALLVAAPLSGLAAVLDPSDRPDFLRPQPARQRQPFHFKLPKSALPEGMASRAISVASPGEPLDGGNLMTFATFPDRATPDQLDLIVQTYPRPAQERDELEVQVEQRVRQLVPFAGDSLQAVDVRMPRWDDDGWLEDPARRAGRGNEADLRVSSRPAVYRLDRGDVAGLGLEGDLLMGWRAGDAIAAELG